MFDKETMPKLTLRCLNIDEKLIMKHNKIDKMTLNFN